MSDLINSKLILLIKETLIDYWSFTQKGMFEINLKFYERINETIFIIILVVSINYFNTKNFKDD